jgi:hypothetical protein
MDYSNLTIAEIEALMIEQEKAMEIERIKLCELAHYRAQACKMQELERKLGSLGADELEMIKSLQLAQSMKTQSIDSQADTNL